MELPLPHDDPGHHRGGLPGGRARPRRLRPLRQAGGTRGLHVPAPRRLDDARCSRASTSANITLVLPGLGRAASGSGSRPSTRSASRASSPRTRSSRPATPRRAKGFLRWQKFSQTIPDFAVGADHQLRDRPPTCPTEVIAAYDAPFPDDIVQGRRAPVPDARADLARRSGVRRRTARRGRCSSSATKPFLTAFSDSDPITAAGRPSRCRSRSPAPPGNRTRRSPAAATSSRRTAARSSPRRRRLHRAATRGERHDRDPLEVPTRRTSADAWSGLGSTAGAGIRQPCPRGGTKDDDGAVGADRALRRPRGASSAGPSSVFVAALRGRRLAVPRPARRDRQRRARRRPHRAHRARHRARLPGEPGHQLRRRRPRPGPRHARRAARPQPRLELRARARSSGSSPRSCSASSSRP